MMPINRRLALTALLLVTLLWAGGFLWTKQALDVGEHYLGRGLDANSAVVGLFMLIRFGAAVCLLPLVLPRVVRSLGPSEWIAGGYLAALLGIGFVLQTVGLQDLNPAVSAFLTSLMVIFTALLGRVFFKHKLRPSLIFGVALATIGAGFISGPPQLHFGWPEWLTVGGAFIFAANILAVDHYTKKLDALKLTWTSLVWMTAIALAVLGFGILQSVNQIALFQLAVDPGFLIPTGLCAVFATVLAFSLMNRFQKSVSPVRAAILYSLEPVWTTGLMLVLGWSGLNGWVVFGGGALLAGNLVAELRGNVPSLHE